MSRVFLSKIDQLKKDLKFYGGLLDQASIGMLQNPNAQNISDFERYQRVVEQIKNEIKERQKIKNRIIEKSKQVASIFQKRLF